MRSALLRSICTLALVVLVGCSSSKASVDADVADITTTTQVDRNALLNEYRTYAWAAAAAMVRDPDHRWTPSGLDVGSEIMSQVDRELRNRGRAQVVESPDMLAFFAIGVDMKAHDIKIDPEDGTKNFEPSPRGGVMVALADAKTLRVIWAGRALGEVSDAPTVALVQKRLDHGIREMFAKFPR